MQIVSLISSCRDGDVYSRPISVRLFISEVGEGETGRPLLESTVSF